MPWRRALRADFDKAIREHPRWPVVVSEGDSWFSRSNVVGRLDRAPGGGQRAWALLRLEKSGDEILTILSGSQRARLRSLFSAQRVDALLLSAGGNDLVGPDLLPLLRPWRGGMTARDAVSFSRFERRLRQITDCWRELLDLLTDARQATRIFVNSYDYAVPSDRPVKLLFGALEVAGPWMKPAFDVRRIPQRERDAVVRLLIDGFCAALDALAAEPRGAGRLIRVETRGAVVADWRDEIHPNARGARRVAVRFAAALADAGLLPQQS